MKKLFKNSVLLTAIIVVSVFASCSKDDDGDGSTTSEVSIVAGENFTDSRDSQVYPTVKIGNQVWMTKNLSFKVPNKSFAYEDNEANVVKYGRLYTFESLADAVPAGWKVATDADWKVLEKSLGMKDVEVNKKGYDNKRGTTEGKDLKEGGRSLLNFPMAGFRDADGSYQALENRTYIWVNTKEGDEVFRRRLVKAEERIYRFTNPAAGFAISVRLLKK